MIKNFTDPLNLKYKPSEARISAKNVQKQLSFAASNGDTNGRGLYFNARDSSIQYESNSTLNDIAAKKPTKQEMILVQLEKNEQLRLNLFKAEKTICELKTVYKSLQGKMVNLLASKKQQFTKKLGPNEFSLEQKMEKRLRKKGEQTNENNGKNHSVQSVLYERHNEIVSIWKDCYSNLIDYISSYSKDIQLLIQQYSTLRVDQEKISGKQKNKQDNLNKILEELNRKLEKSEITIEKTLNQLRGRDNKIEHYQAQNKALKTKILECLEEIERVKRDHKLQIRDNQSFKDVTKSMQKQIVELSNTNRELQQQLEIKQERESLSNAALKSLNERIKSLEQEISETKKFNDNLIEQYKKVSSKAQNSEEKLCEKYQFYETICHNKIKEYQILVLKTIKDKQCEQSKFQLKIRSLKSQIQKCQAAKLEVEKQLIGKNKGLEAIKQQSERREKEFLRVEENIMARLEQKERQIHYLEELKSIAGNKNEELKKEVDEVRSDLLIIIQELKVKDLQIEKYRQLQKNQARQTVSNQQKSTTKNNQSPRSLGSQEDHDLEQEPGIIWKKIKNQSDFQAPQPTNENFYFQSSTNYKWWEQNLDKKTVGGKGRQNFEMACNRTVPKLRIFGSELQTNNRNGSFEGRNKFNLQAFQNKLLIEGGAKVLLKLNQTMYC